MRRAPARLIAALVVTAMAACSSGDSSAPVTTEPGGGVTTSASPETTAEPTPSTDATVASPTTAPGTVATTPPVTAGESIPPPPTSSTTAPPTTSNDSTSSTTTTVALSPEARGDIQLAESALIDLSSFPEGWTAEPAAETPDNEEFEERFDGCFGRTSESPTEILSERNAESDEFSGPGDTRPSVEHTVSMAPDEPIALSAMQEVATEGASPCLAAVVQEFFEAEFAADADVPDGLTLGQVTIVRTDDGAAPDRRIGYRLEVPLMLDGQTFSQYLDVIYQRSGRALSNLQFSSFAVPFPDEGIDALTDEVDTDLAVIGS